MISRILANILAYILSISLSLCFLGGGISLIILGIRGLEEEDWSYLLVIALGCVSIMIVAIVILKAFGL